MDNLPDLAVGEILQRSFAGMDAGLVPWLRLSLVCRCASRLVQRRCTGVDKHCSSCSSTACASQVHATGAVRPAGTLFYVEFASLLQRLRAHMTTCSIRVRRQWRRLMLGLPVDLVFRKNIKKQAKWLVATKVPLRSVTFHRSHRHDLYIGTGVRTERVIADSRSFAASRNTLEVTRLRARPCIGPARKPSQTLRF